MAGFLARRSLAYYWRTNLAVAAGVAVATAVLTGALLVGDSVRASLERLAFARLGRAEVWLSKPTPFRESLAASESLATPPAPLLLLEGLVVHDASGRRAARVSVYGVDDRFWGFHGVQGVGGPEGRTTYASPALATELGAAPGDTLLLTVDAPTDIPAGVLQGRRTDRARTLRLELARTLAEVEMGEFALRPTQAAVRALFVPLRLLQRELKLSGRVNSLLFAGTAAAVGQALEAGATLEDLGLRLRPLPAPDLVAVESAAGYLAPRVAAAILDVCRTQALTVTPVLTYLATSIRIGDREIPYSVVSGINHGVRSLLLANDAGRPENPGDLPELWLSEWAADDLAPARGAQVTLDYHVWSDEEGLLTRSAAFRFAGVVPMDGPGSDATLTPDYPGLTDEVSMSDWDPPFPVDLRRVRDRDEAFWKQYRAAPKAFVRLATAQRLWGGRYGELTSLRLRAEAGRDPERTVAALEQALLGALDPSAHGGFSIVDVRDAASRASAGTTDFGEYFLYFTFFLVAASLLLAGLMFRLTLEQRLRELGLLRAVGFSTRDLRAHLVREGLVLGATGTVVGLAGALVWAGLVMTGLRTWWIDAVGTDKLVLHPSWRALAPGALAGLLAGAVTLWWTLRSLASLPPRVLLSAVEAPAGDEIETGASARSARRARATGVTAAAAAAVVLGAALTRRLGPVVGFFGAGGLMLLAALFLVGAWLRRAPGAPVTGAGWWPVARIGGRGVRHRPGRGTTAVALIAFATFILVAVGAFRRAPDANAGDARSGTGGFTLIGESTVPLFHDPNTPAGRAALGLPETEDLQQASFARVRLRRGDEASCLTLYRPIQPRIAGVPDRLIESDRFRFVRVLTAGDGQGQDGGRGQDEGQGAADGGGDDQRPWRVLRRPFADGTVPAFGDANSLAYVFHLGLGDTLTVSAADGSPVTLRIAGILSDSVFQSELLVAEEQFVRLFPREDGYRMLLVESEPRTAADLSALLEQRLGDYGLDLEPTSERLARYHRVENTYISTFEALGGLGLLLGTCGVGAMLLRSVFERRRELALLQAVGYRPGHLSLMIAAESVLVAALGALIGTVCALLAIAPALLEHGTSSSWGRMALLPLLVVGVALASSLVAATAAGRVPVAGTLRTE